MPIVYSKARRMSVVFILDTATDAPVDIYLLGGHSLLDMAAKNERKKAVAAWHAQARRENHSTLRYHYHEMNLVAFCREFPGAGGFRIVADA